MLFDIVHAMIVHTVKLIEQQGFLAFQVLNIFCQTGDFLSQLPMPKHLECRYRFLFLQQNPALLDLSLELLNYILIPFDVWLNDLESIRKMFFSGSNMQKLIPEDNHFLAHSFYRLSQSRDSAFYCVHQILNQ